MTPAQALEIAKNIADHPDKETMISAMADALLKAYNDKQDYRVANEFQSAIHFLGHFMLRAYVIEQPILTINFQSKRDEGAFRSLLNNEALNKWGLVIDKSEFTMHGIKIRINNDGRYR